MARFSFFFFFFFHFFRPAFLSLQSPVHVRERAISLRGFHACLVGISFLFGGFLILFFVRSVLVVRRARAPCCLWIDEWTDTTQGNLSPFWFFDGCPFNELFIAPRLSPNNRLLTTFPPFFSFLEMRWKKKDSDQLPRRWIWWNVLRQQFGQKKRERKKWREIEFGFWDSKKKRIWIYFEGQKRVEKRRRRKKER